MEKKKVKNVVIFIIIVVSITCICIFFKKYTNLTINENVIINSNEAYIATIYYNYDAGTDASINIVF